jgi:hypothetical protein
VSRRTAALAPLLALTLAWSLAGCGGDDKPDPDSTAPVEVTVGKEFSWNGFTVDDGWQVKGIKRSVDMQEVTTPEVSGTITNHSDEERAALFQMVFSTDGDPQATVNCSAAKMVKDQSMQLLCPGLNTIMPEDYDTVTVMPFQRGTGTTGGDDSGT